MALKHVNAVVIGSGAGGGVAAEQLALAGLSVVLLERGRWQYADEHRKDDLLNQRNATLGPAYGPDLKKNPRVFVHADGREEIVDAASWLYHNNAACVGGGTLSYGAMAWRFMEQDFRMRSIYGQPEESVLEDWPITYDDLEPFYEKAEYEIGVSGDVEPDPFKSPRKKPLPMPPHPHSKESRMLHKAARRLGWHPFDIPMLRNTVPYGGRPECMRCRWCVGFACECDAKCGTHNTVIPRAVASGNCEVRTECIAAEIVTDDRGRARSVIYFDGDDRRHEQTADLVVVAGSAVETARLLLNSKSRLFPEGLGNRYDWVGRCLQGHTYTGASGLFEEDLYDDLGPGAQIAICDFNHDVPGLVGGGMIANEFIRLPYQYVTGWRPENMPRWGKERKDFMRNYYRRSARVMGPVQEIPIYDARVQVDPAVTDHWGIPVARLSGSRHRHSVEIGAFLADRAEEWLLEAGATTTWKQLAGMGLSGGQHQAGTCRMGDDPQLSVTNRYGQLYETDNVFIADGSLHVTNGGFNPVLTIMALGYYVSDYIVRAWKGNGLA